MIQAETETDSGNEVEAPFSTYLQDSLCISPPSYTSLCSSYTSFCFYQPTHPGFNLKKGQTCIYQPSSMTLFLKLILYSLVLFLLCVATTLHCKEWYDSCTFDVLTRSCQCVKLIILLSLLDTQFPELKICALDFKTTASCRCILWEHSHLGAFGLSTEVATEA